MDVTQVLLKVLDVANPLAGMAAEFIAGKLGLSDKTTEAVSQAVSGMSGADQVKLKQIAADLQDHMAQYGLQLQTVELQTGASQVADVNKTLQTEAMGGSWLQRNHHAIESLSATAMVIALYVLLPIMRIPVPSVPVEAFIMIGGIIGVTSWQRGQANIATATASKP